MASVILFNYRSSLTIQLGSRAKQGTTRERNTEKIRNTKWEVLFYHATETLGGIVMQGFL